MKSVIDCELGENNTIRIKNTILKLFIDNWRWCYVFKNKRHYIVLLLNGTNDIENEESLEVFDFDGNSIAFIKYKNAKLHKTELEAATYYYKRLKL